MNFNVGNALANLAKAGASKTKVERPMCSGCAFKKGTPANGETDAAGRALDCLLADNLIFNCHQERDKVCTGYLLAKAADE